MKKLVVMNCAWRVKDTLADRRETPTKEGYSREIRTGMASESGIETGRSEPLTQWK